MQKNSTLIHSLVTLTLTCMLSNAPLQAMRRLSEVRATMLTQKVLRDMSSFRNAQPPQKLVLEKQFDELYQDYKEQWEDTSAKIQKEKIKLNVLNPLLVTAKIASINGFAMPVGGITGKFLGVIPSEAARYWCSMFGREFEYDHVITQLTTYAGFWGMGTAVIVYELYKNNKVREHLKYNIARLEGIQKTLQEKQSLKDNSSK